mgnify:CR=1 FL=1
MKIEFIHWIIFSIIEAVSVVYCYKKISRVNKVNIHFTLLCLGIVFLTDFTTLIHYSIRYMMFFIQPLFFYLYFIYISKLPFNVKASYATPYFTIINLIKTKNFKDIHTTLFYFHLNFQNHNFY